MSSTAPTPPTLVQLLADGAWHSGPVLAATLGIGRAAVSARVAELRTLGMDIHSVVGRGYRLRTPLELLDAACIRAALAPAMAARLGAIDVFERIDSTNAELARGDRDTTRACFAEYQSAGRGRGQRGWASPFGANLYLSLGYRLAVPRAPLGALSLAVGASLATMLAGLGATSIGLKWPNDLWAAGQKLGGILIEHRGETAGSARLIIGVGLNVAMTDAEAQGLDQPWTRLADHVPNMPRRNALAAHVLEAVLAAATAFETQGFAGFRGAWERFDIARDAPVRILEPGGQRQGIARGIAADGALRLEIDGAIEPVYSGDVSLRIE